MALMQQSCDSIINLGAKTNNYFHGHDFFFTINHLVYKVSPKKVEK